MTRGELKKLIADGETVHLECKLAENATPADFWPSYSAFANTDGGTIILGIREKDGKREIEGLLDAENSIFSLVRIGERSGMGLIDKNALFVTRQNHKRITTAAVHKLVKKHLAAAGLDSTQYSSHKLRHTAATLMLQNGVDVRTLQEVLGHEHLNTTQIYTHVDNDDLRTAAKANPLGKVHKTSKKTNEDE